MIFIKIFADNEPDFCLMDLQLLMVFIPIYYIVKFACDKKKTDIKLIPYILYGILCVSIGCFMFYCPVMYWDIQDNTLYYMSMFMTWITGFSYMYVINNYIWKEHKV